MAFDAGAFGVDDDEPMFADDAAAQRIAAQRLAKAQKPSAGDRAGGALSGGLSGAATGASLGTMINPGIGTAIGAVGGALIGGVGGALTADKGQPVDTQGMAGDALSLAGTKFGQPPREEVASPFGLGTKAFKAKTLGGRKGVQSEDGDWDLPSSDFEWGMA